MVYSLGPRREVIDSEEIFWSPGFVRVDTELDIFIVVHSSRVDRPNYFSTVGVSELKGKD